jgi:hypothetical protein
LCIGSWQALWPFGIAVRYDGLAFHGLAFHGLAFHRPLHMSMQTAHFAGFALNAGQTPHILLAPYLLPPASVTREVEYNAGTLWWWPRFPALPFGRVRFFFGTCVSVFHILGGFFIVRVNHPDRHLAYIPLPLPFHFFITVII